MFILTFLATVAGDVVAYFIIKHWLALILKMRKEVPISHRDFFFYERFLKAKRPRPKIGNGLFVCSYCLASVANREIVFLECSRQSPRIIYNT